MRKKIVSGNFIHDVKRMFFWIGGKAKGRLKGKGKGFFHRVFEAMNR